MSTATTNVPGPDALRDHFDIDGVAIFLDCGRRSTAAYVRERWNKHPLTAQAVVWDSGCAIVCSERAAEQIQQEVPDHWFEYVDETP